MNVVESRYIDKSTWPPGPWHDEPDRVEWRYDGAPRFPLLILRAEPGYFCGYVGVPPGHPWHSVDAFTLDAHAHGGVNYGAPCSGNICHKPRPGEPDDVWWIGFDCGHPGDRWPGIYRIAELDAVLDSMPFPFERHYRDVDYVRAQVERLAAQAAAACAP